MAMSHHPLAPYVRGAVSLVEAPGGLVTACRFFPEQFEHLRKIGRYDRASATAGVVIDFATDGTEASLECRVVRDLNANHPLYQTVMDLLSDSGAPLGSAEEGNIDGIDIVVDDRLLATVPVRDGVLRFAFENPDHAEREVRIYLPSIMNVAFGNLRTNGSMKPLPQRGYLLTLGDSITQGFVCGSPMFAYPSLVARTLGIDLINQAVAGHVFDEGVLGGFSLWRDEPPEVIVVAYGTNDWARKRSSEAIEGDAVAFLDRLHRLFPGIPTYVLSPLWRTDEHEPMPCDRPLTWMHEMLQRVCLRYEGVHVVDGYHGIPKDPAVFADGRLHPDRDGMGLVADLLLEAICADGVDMLVARRIARRLGKATGGPSNDEFISREERIDQATALRNGSPETHPQFDRVVRTIWRLRQPDGCPWDKKQTYQSLAKHLVEEAYEAAEALRQGDVDHICEELGDVLEQVLLNAQIGYDERTFNIDDVCEGLNEKLVRRHPHVFGESTSVDSPEEVLRIWNDVKQQERAEGTVRRGLLDSVPVTLPALMQAQKISKRAAAAGFEWQTVEDVWDKVAEERREFEREDPGTMAAAEEFGDLLFALVNVARHCGIDAEEALAASNAKFRRRWAAMEARAEIEELDTDELNELWDAVKGNE